jgi:hypothetical protein
MPQTAERIHAASRAPEYGRTAGAKVSTDAHPVTESANEARQGVIGHNVNIVLVVSTLAAFAGVFIVWALFFAR